MGDLKTHLLGFVFGLAAGIGALPGPSTAMPDIASDQARLFATCLGRYSAAREHAWLMGGEDAQANAGFDLFQDLLEAVTPDAIVLGVSAKQLLANRIEAKMAQARLMQASVFQNTPQNRANAERLATHHLLACTSVVMG